MTRTYFLKTQRIGFAVWQKTDLPLAEQLWGDPRVTHYIHQNGAFNPVEIATRLQTEINQEKTAAMQYWPIFNLTTGQFIGCCGLKPVVNGAELGYHLRPEFWHQGYAAEAAAAAIRYAFNQLKLPQLVAGHHPANLASGIILRNLGFHFIGTEYYAPTGLEHPTYVLVNRRQVNPKATR